MDRAPQHVAVYRPDAFGRQLPLANLTLTSGVRSLAGALHLVLIDCTYNRYLRVPRPNRRTYWVIGALCTPHPYDWTFGSVVMGGLSAVDADLIGESVCEQGTHSKQRSSTVPYAPSWCRPWVTWCHTTDCHRVQDGGFFPPPRVLDTSLLVGDLNLAGLRPHRTSPSERQKEVPHGAPHLVKHSPVRNLSAVLVWGFTPPPFPQTNDRTRCLCNENIARK